MTTLGRRDAPRAASYALLPVFILVLAIFFPSGVVKAVPGLVQETESVYNYVQVIDDEGWRLLTVNEGQAYQSAYRADRVSIGRLLSFSHLRSPSAKIFNFISPASRSF